MIELVQQPAKVDLTISGNYAEGYKKGYTNGKTDGANEGYSKGHQEGLQEGHASGYAEGHKNGLAEGFASGHEQGLAEGVEQGKEAENGAFWDALQDNGNRTDYQYAFYNWGKECIEPKYNINVDNLYLTFFGNKKLKKSPIVNYSGKGFTNMFGAYKDCFELEEIPFDIVMDSTNTGALNQLLTRCYKLKSIKLVLDSTAYAYSYTFEGCSSLENLIIEGEINSNGFNVIYCPLTHDSLMSIINALKDFSGTTETRTIKIGNKNLPKLTDAEKAIATQKGWSLIA